MADETKFVPEVDQRPIKYDEMRVFSDEDLNNYTEEELKNYKVKYDIPFCEEMEKGPWPSYVADAKREALHRHKLGQDKLLIDVEVVDCFHVQHSTASGRRSVMALTQRM